MCDWALLGALERLDVVAAPSTQSGSPLQAVLEALRATQAILEASQTARFGAKVSKCMLSKYLQHHELLSGGMYLIAHYSESVKPPIPATVRSPLAHIVVA